MSYPCLSLGDTLEVVSGELRVKLAPDSRISLDPTDGLYLNDDELTTDWVAWTPTFDNTGFTLGNATVEAYYMRFGQLIFWKVALKLGSTSSMGTSGPYFDLPVSPAAWGQVGTANQPLGYSAMTGGSFIYVGEVGQGVGDGATVGCLYADSTYAGGTVLDSTTPFTWATGNTWIAQGFYERA